MSQAMDQLYGSNWVTGEEDVTFQAGESVELLPGFEVEAEEGDFIAQIGDCQSPGAGQNAGQYVYDGSGNIIKNEDGADISWDLYGKVKNVSNLPGGLISQVNFGYDPLGDRISKSVVNGTSNEEKTTFYVRDVSGNVMATYKLSNTGLSWEEQYIYGASRIGTNKELAKWGTASEIGSIPLGEENGIFNRGRKYYELANHLGNVLSVINDRKKKVDSGTDGFADYYEATIVSSNDYYPFGLEMPQRTFSSPEYRYGFNGKEKDQKGEWGSLTHYDYGFRIYNPAIGRFLSIDPLSPDYPELTPYQFASNRPIDGIDIDGLEWGKAAKYAAKQTLKKLAKEQIENQIKKRLAGYTSKKWAKQLANDAYDAFDLLESSWWETAVEFIPQVGDAYAVGSTGYKGYKFWKRIDRISDRIDAVADNVKRASTKLAKSLGGLEKGFQAHHLIPVQALKQSAVVQDAIAAGFKFNGKKNGIGVKAFRKKSGKGQHANHPAYNTQVLDKLKKFAQDNPDYTPKEAKAFVEGMAKELKAKVKKESVKGGKKVNDLDLFSKPPRA